MKRILTLITALVMGAACSVAQQQLQALFSYSTFYVASAGTPYVETYLSFDAWTMQFAKTADGDYRATAEVLILVEQGDSVCYYKKYDLNSPSVKSLDDLNFSFIDVQRFSLRNGIYDLTVTLRDKGSDAPESVVEEKLAVAYDNQHPVISSLQLMASVTPTKEQNILSRNGYDMQPYVSDFFPERVSQIHFYYEIYNIDKEIGRKPFLTLAFVEDRETGARFETQRHVAKKYSAASVPVYGSLDIAELPSGNYNLVVEARNSDNDLMLYKKLPFFRSNPGVKAAGVSDFATTFAGAYTDEKQLNTYIDALNPIASEYERSAARDLIRRPGLEEKQAFLYTFWQKRNALNPEGEWLKYKERVDYVQATFSYPRTQGIHTDRGRVYLQYGPPDFVRDEKNFVSALYLGKSHTGDVELMQSSGNGTSEMNVKESQGHVYYLPYQLWRYNKLATDDPDRVFLFWDEHRSGYYTLLNSNARGEVQDPGWERRLCRNQLGEGIVGEVGQQFNRGY
jgi:GWxTD domain-containing protein